MHDQIIERRFYENVERHPAEQVSVEVACALEGLNDAYALIHTSDDSAPNAIASASASGCILARAAMHSQRKGKGTGRFRPVAGKSDAEIDITGHAASAFMKSVENGIESASSWLKIIYALDIECSGISDVQRPKVRFLAI